MRYSISLYIAARSGCTSCIILGLGGLNDLPYKLSNTKKRLFALSDGIKLARYHHRHRCPQKCAARHASYRIVGGFRALSRVRISRMYHAIIQQYIRQLHNLSAILTKAVDHAAARKFDPNNYLGLRLAPDMFPLVKQIQTATDVAKAAAGTFGNKDIPKYPDTESTMAEVQTRVQNTHRLSRVVFRQRLRP